MKELNFKLGSIADDRTDEDVMRAINFAADAHRGQRRSEGTPYFFHVLEVGGRVSTLTLDRHILQAAYLHDTVEDTHVTLDDITRMFSPWTSTLVAWLTLPPALMEMSRDKSKREEYLKGKEMHQEECIERGPIEASLIKVADKVANGLSLRHSGWSHGACLSYLDTSISLMRSVLWAFVNEYMEISRRYEDQRFPNEEDLLAFMKENPASDHTRILDYIFSARRLLKEERRMHMDHLVRRR